MTQLGYMAIADELERQILNGELKTDDRLPATKAMALEWSVSPLTIQRSLRRLADKGMVKRVPGRGTVVIATMESDTLGLIFGTDIKELPSPYYLAVLSAFQRLSGNYGFQTREYVVFDDKAVFRSLTDLEADARAGGLRAFVPIYFNNKLRQWLKSANDLPYIELNGFDMRQMLFEGFAHLQEQGYERIAYLSLIGKPRRTHYENILREREMEAVERAGLQLGKGVGKVDVIEGIEDEAQAYAFCAKALKERSYDAFFVAHDRVLRGVVMAVLESGLKPGRDVGVLGNQNKGCEIFSPFGLSHFLCDPADIAERSLAYAASANTVLMPGRNLCPDIAPYRFIPSVSTRR